MPTFQMVAKVFHSGLQPMCISIPRPKHPLGKIMFYLNTLQQLLYNAFWSCLILSCHRLHYKTNNSSTHDGAMSRLFLNPSVPRSHQKKGGLLFLCKRHRCLESVCISAELSCFLTGLCGGVEQHIGGVISEHMNGWMVTNWCWWTDERSDSSGDSVRKVVWVLFLGQMSVLNTRRCVCSYGRWKVPVWVCLD